MGSNSKFLFTSVLLVTILLFLAYGTKPLFDFEIAPWEEISGKIQIPTPTPAYISGYSVDEILNKARSHGLNSPDLIVNEDVAFKKESQFKSRTVKAIRISSCQLNKTILLDSQTTELLESRNEAQCDSL